MGLFVDVTDPGRYLEEFLVESWLEHLRQHERVTVSDREVQERVDLHVGPIRLACHIFGAGEIGGKKGAATIPPPFDKI